jgi:hypothetical protein
VGAADKVRMGWPSEAAEVAGDGGGRRRGGGVGDNVLDRDLGLETLAASI